MAISLEKSHVKEIERHGEAAFPHECCGFILGTADGDSRSVSELLSADNDREEGAQHNRFLITAEAYMRGEKAARSHGLDIVGFYHSHPNAPARPSQYDLDHAWPWYSYIIVSIQDKVADAMTSWVLAEDRSAFEEEELTTQD